MPSILHSFHHNPRNHATKNESDRSFVQFQGTEFDFPFPFDPLRPSKLNQAHEKKSLKKTPKHHCFALLYFAHSQPPCYARSNKFQLSFSTT
jgi:hypothetical protein